MGGFWADSLGGLEEDNERETLSMTLSQGRSCEAWGDQAGKMALSRTHHPGTLAPALQTPVNETTQPQLTKTRTQDLGLQAGV